MSYTVGQVAEIANVTVRTLHHYDRIGLLSASARSEGGYRRYEASDVARLHQVLSYRELGIPLEEIASLLDEPDSDPSAHLRRQERLLRERIGRLEEMLAATRTMMEAHEMSIDLTPVERFELFGDFVPAVHAKEAEERWGGTDAHEESQRRTRAYGKEDWRRIQEEAREIERSFVRAMLDGAEATDPRATDLAEAHRRHISRWFYDCTPEVHRALGEMYVADPRFAAHFEELAAGTARYVRDAVVASAERGGTAPAGG